MYRASQGCWRTGAADAPVLTNIAEFADADAQLQRDVIALGEEQIWAGAVPRGLHGRLTWAGMSEAAATKLLRVLSAEANVAAMPVWRARCEWMNEREARVQKRNRWREASRRVMSRLQLHHMTKRAQNLRAFGQN